MPSHRCIKRDGSISSGLAAFALSIPEAADVPAGYAIRRHAEGNGRKDILTLGEQDSASPFIRVEIYRPGNEIGRFADPQAEMLSSAVRPRCSNSINRSGAKRATRDRVLRHVNRYTTPLPRLRARLPRSARAIVRLVLSGRHRVRRAKPTGVCD